MARKKVDVVIERYEYMPCSCKLMINGYDADKDDFGEAEYEQPEPYTCSNRRFIPKLPTDKVLKKYKINLKDYADICEKLESALYVGHCGYCI